jgi:hypothetical protein
LQTKEIPELEHDVRQSTAQIELLTDLLEAANHKYDDVTQPLIAQVEELTGRVKNLNSEVRKRDEKIAALQNILQDQRIEQKQCEARILDLKQRNEALTSTIQSLVRCDICQAAKAGDLSVVSLWITLRCDVNKRDHECVNENMVIDWNCCNVLMCRQWTPLHWASGSGRCDIAEILLENGADVRAKDDE